MEFTSPYGRLVQGHPMVGQDKDKDGKPYIAKSGKNAGQPITKYFVSVAFPKMVDYGAANGGVQANKEFGAFYAMMDAQARASFPHLFPPNGTGPCTHPRFAWKLMDGDGIDSNGKQNNTKEGFAGHWIVKFASQYAPRCFFKDKYDPSQQIQNPKEIKTGDYCRISGSMDGNGVAAGSSEVPGLFINLNLFEHSFYGTEIVSGPDASAAFGGTNSSAGPVPQGATSTPVGGASATPAMPGATGPALPNTQAAPPATGPALPNTAVPSSAPPLPNAGATPGAVPGTAAGITPNTNFVAGATNPPMPAPQPQLVLTAAAVQAGYTLESFRANGWSDEQIVGGGWAIRQ